MSDVAAEAIIAWRRSTPQFVRDVFGAAPDRWQHNALVAFDSNDPDKARIALQACVGPGKSTVLSWCGWKTLLTQTMPGKYPNGYAVSITADNLKDNLWKELAIWRERSPILQRSFELTGTQIYERDHPDTWWLRARSFAKSADAQALGRTLSGLHAPFIFYLIDEGGDMPTPVVQTAEQGLSNCEWGKIIMAGNPSSQTGALYNAVKAQSHLWHVIRITGDPDDPDRSPRISLEWARQMIDTYGRENPWVMYAILGLFPPTAMNALLGPDEVRDAMGRHLRTDQYSFAQKRLGIDPARFGQDETVIFPRQGLAAFTPVKLRHADTTQIATRVLAAKAKWGSELELIDSTGGWHGGVVDQARLSGVNIIEINASSSADDPHFFNKRSEMYWRAAEWVKGGGALPNVPELVREATAATYWFDKSRIRVLEKEQIKVLLQGKSPDTWEALLQTFAMVDMPGGSQFAQVAATAGRQIPHEWEPYQ